MEPRDMHLATLVVLGFAVGALVAIQFVPWATVPEHHSDQGGPGEWGHGGSSRVSTWGYVQEAPANGHPDAAQTKTWFGDWGEGEGRHGGVGMLAAGAVLMLLALLLALGVFLLSLLRLGGLAGFVGLGTAALLLVGVALFWVGVSVFYDGEDQAWHVGPYLAVTALVLVLVGSLMAILMPGPPGPPSQESLRAAHEAEDQND